MLLLRTLCYVRILLWIWKRDETSLDLITSLSLSNFWIKAAEASSFFSVFTTWTCCVFLERKKISIIFPLFSSSFCCFVGCEMRFAWWHDREDRRRQDERWIEAFEESTQERWLYQYQKIINLIDINKKIPERNFIQRNLCVLQRFSLMPFGMC